MTVDDIKSTLDNLMFTENPTTVKQQATDLPTSKQAFSYTPRFFKQPVKSKINQVLQKEIATSINEIDSSTHN